METDLQRKPRVRLEYGHSESIRRKHEVVIPIAIREAPPFVCKGYGCMIHRVRSGAIYVWRDGKFPTHWAGNCWCGQQWTLKRNRFLHEVPDGSVVCATCEGRATGAGQLESHKINGRMVKFSPRTPRC